VHGDDGGAALVGRAAGPTGSPEWVVEQDHVGAEFVQCGVQFGATERHAVAVGGRHAQGAMLVPPTPLDPVTLPGMTR
jgi:hypothetical protein